MTNTYFLWEKSDLYTNYGLAEVWIIFREFERRKQFESTLRFPGMLNNRVFNDVPVDMSPMMNPSSKVYYITTRQNAAQDPRRSFYNPMHVFCKTNGQKVYAKDLVVGDYIVAFGNEVRVEFIQIFDYGESHWVMFTTAGMSPNIYVNSILTFPTSLDEILKFEQEQNMKLVESKEYEGQEEVPVYLPEDIQVIEIPNIKKRKSAVAG